MLVQRHAIVTEEDFLQLPESQEKVELLDGEVHVTPSPTFWHQELLCRVVTELRNWAAGQERPVTVGQAPLDVRMGQNRILQPDAFVLFGRVPRQHSGPLDLVPAVCIEVLSADRVYDRVTKRFIYAAAGVDEYWIVDPAGVVERWHGPGLGQMDVVEKRLATALLEGFSLEIAKLFAEM